MKISLGARLLAEFLGTAFLLIAIVGSGIMGERLSGGNTAIALLATSLATGCGLYVLISALKPVGEQHICRHSLGGCAWLCRGATARSPGRDRPALPRAPSRNA